MKSVICKQIEACYIVTGGCPFGPMEQRGWNRLGMREIAIDKGPETAKPDLGWPGLRRAVAILWLGYVVANTLPRIRLLTAWASDVVT